MLCIKVLEFFFFFFFWVEATFSHFQQALLQGFTLARDLFPSLSCKNWVPNMPHCR
jgi:hypothetical protein